MDHDESQYPRVIICTIDERIDAIAAELIGGGITLQQAQRAFARKYVAVAKRLARGNATRAARLLGVHRNTVANRTKGMQ